LSCQRTHSSGPFAMFGVIVTNGLNVELIPGGVNTQPVSASTVPAATIMNSLRTFLFQT